MGSVAVAQGQSHCLARSSLGFDPGQSRNFKFLAGTEIRRHGGAELQLLASLTNISGLNLKSLRSAYDVKVHVLLKKFVPCLGYLNLAAPWCFSIGIGYLAASGFTFKSSSPHIHHSYITSQYNTYTYTHPWHFLILTDASHSAMWPTELV